MAKGKTDKTVIIKNGLVALLTLLVIMYVVYVVGRASLTQIKTVSAAETTAYNSVSVKGYVIRKETLIEYKGNGVISYNVSDGEKVSKNESVATVFADTDLSSKQQELEELESRMATLKQLQKSVGTITANPDEIDRNISRLLSQANINIVNGNLSSADGNIEDVLYNINERQLVTEKVSSFEEKISELQDRINAIKKAIKNAKKSEEIKSSVTGYFVSRADGYENTFDIKKLDQIMPGDLKDGKIKPNDISRNVIGKTIDGVYWYIACEVNANEALKIKNTSELKVNIPVVSNKNITVELESVNQKNKSSDAVIILKGTYMNSEMANIRSEDISIVLEEHTGIYVPKSAVHEQKLTGTVTDKDGKEHTEERNVSGVYVSVGSEISFKQIIPVYSGEDYIISSTNVNDEVFSDEAGRLQLYDQIITEGANLYDGKIIKRNS